MKAQANDSSNYKEHAQGDNDQRIINSEQQLAMELGAHEYWIRIRN